MVVWMEQTLSMAPLELRALLSSKTSPCHQILLSRAVPGGCATGKAVAGQGKGAKEAGRKKELHPLPAANHPPLPPKRGNQVCKHQVEFSPWRGSTALGTGGSCGAGLDGDIPIPLLLR